ncbi:MAG: Ig-like domain-containing protein, partial [Candidatus Hodarchaeales archaeon]|jgi:hypothetical protein
MTGTAKTAMTDWFDSGNKSILMGGDGDYGGYVNATYLNDPLVALDSSIYFEMTSIDDTVSNIGGGTYRVKAPNYNTHNDTAKILMGSLPHGNSVYHGPAAIIGKNSTGDFVPLEESSGMYMNPDFDAPNVEWLLRTSKDGVDVKTQIGAYQVHSTTEVNNFTIAAVETFPSIDGKLILTGETIWNTWKDQFMDPSERNALQDNRYFVYNAFNWFAPVRARAFVPMSLKIETPVTETLSASNDVYLNWTAGIFNTEAYYAIYVDGNARNMTGKMEYTLNDLDDGNHTIQVLAHTVFGFTGFSNKINVTVDTTAPVLAIVSPTSGTTITEGDSINLVWSATDATTAIDTFEVFVDDVSMGNQTTTTYSLTTPSVGSHVVKIVATDTAGNSAEITFNFVVEAMTTTTTTTTTTTDDAPGFSLIPAFLVIGIAVIVSRRRRK